jgi:hypothetical protein
MSATATASANLTESCVPEDGYGDFTKERHERPERPIEDIITDIMRLQAAHPERLNVKPVTPVRPQ